MSEKINKDAMEGIHQNDKLPRGNVAVQYIKDQEENFEQAIEIHIEKMDIHWEVS
jgi:hypothetical protein